MANVDLIARLYAYDDYAGGKEARQAIKLNPSRYAPAQLVVSPFTSVPQSPSDQEPAQPPNQWEAPPYLYNPCLELRFSHGPQTDAGFVIGHGPDSDITVPFRRGVGFHHCAIKFDEKNRLIVKDLNSIHGTAVSYDDEGKDQRRSNFVWIVGGDKVPKAKTTIIIHIHNYLNFQVVVSQHDITSEPYIDKVNRFRESKEEPGNRLGRHDLHCPPTQPDSRADALGAGAIVLRKTLGKGAFGVVSHIWNVSTGDEYALKEPSEEAVRQNSVNIGRWKKEADIMKRVPHDNIVRILDFEHDPLPQLHLEYMHGGSLRDQKNILARECVEILRQCLSALAYLHGHSEPIAHRDIKPENILVQCRDADDIHVKLADFGLTREGDHLTTQCGTPLYVAPEVYEIERRAQRTGIRSYTPAVDIWSLGVVVFEYADNGGHNLPSHTDTNGGISWCQAIVEKLKKDLGAKPDELKHFLTSMVVVDPPSRRSAQECHDQALLLSAPTQDRCPTPAPACHPKNRHHTAIQDGQHQRSGILHPQKWLESSPATLESTAAGRKIGPPQSPSSEGRRERIRTASGSLSCQQQENQESGAAYFRESWLRDPLYPHGGGSTLAAEGGHETSKWNGLANPTSENPVSQDMRSPAGDDHHGEDAGLPQKSRDHDQLAVTEGGLAPSGAIQALSSSWAESEEFMAAQLLLALGGGYG